MSKKKYTHKTITGQRGVNIIENIVLKMGFVWHSTNLDAGIDGTIEIRDSETEEATNFIIQVQSKATSTGFQGESEDKFEYYCDEKDLDYWLQGNCPVVLICVDVNREQAYWVSIKDYFKDKTKLKSRKVTFNKSKNCFDTSIKEQLASLSIPDDSGFYFTPPIKDETLYSNMLKLQEFPTRIFSAKTEYRDGKELWNDLNNLDNKKGINKSWILQNELIYSFNDLNQSPWDNIHNGNVISFLSSDWSQSYDINIKRGFVKLLNSTFESFAYSKNLIRKKTKQFDLYYFRPQKDRNDLPRSIDLKYNRFGRNSKQNICNRYYRKKEPNVISYFRHLSFEKNFHRLGSDWYLEINPTYLFTHDGFKVHTYYESKLKGKKGLDKAETVFSQVLFWSQILSRDEGMFSKSVFKFSDISSFAFERGIDDKLWLEKEDKEIKNKLISEKGLFE